MKYNRYYYIDEIYNSRKWYKKKLGKLAEKEVKKQIEVLLMYEYYHISPNFYTDENGHFVAEYRTLDWAAELVKEKLLISKPKLIKLTVMNIKYAHLKRERFGYYDYSEYRIKEWYKTHKHLLKLQ